VKQILSAADVAGNPIKLSAASLADLKEKILLDMPACVKQMDSLRAGTKDRKSVDISFGEFVQEKYGFAIGDNKEVDAFYHVLGVNPSNATVQSLLSMPDFDEGFRWLLPEVIREAVRLGLRKSPAYPFYIAGEESVTQPSVIMPSIKLSDAMPTKIGEAESIPAGTIQFQEKTVKLQKLGVGLEMTDEVRDYVPLNVLSMYLQDVGVKMNLGKDADMVDVLINGDQTSGVNAAVVIGVESTVAGFTYKDLLRAWIRMGALGRLPQNILSNENPALDILLLTEFRNREYLQNPAILNVRTPVPQSANYDIHGAMPSANQIMMVDATSALIKLNASALRVETDRIASRQINGTYVTETTGFANLFNDARLIMDKSLAFSAAGFPATFNPYAVQAETYKS
jgi:hypothetical protein